MTNAKKIVNKVMIALLAVVMVVASLGFAASMLEADDNSGISMNTDVENVADMEYENLPTTYGTSSYTETPWNGSIRLKDQFLGIVPSGSEQVNIFMDPQNKTWASDQIIIEIEGRLRTYIGEGPIKLQHASVEVQFYANGQPAGKRKESLSNFEKVKYVLKSDSNKVDKVFVSLIITGYGGNSVYACTFAGK